MKDQVERSLEGRRVKTETAESGEFLAKVLFTSSSLGGIYWIGRWR